MEVKTKFSRNYNIKYTLYGLCTLSCHTLVGVFSCGVLVRAPARHIQFWRGPGDDGRSSDPPCHHISPVTEPEPSEHQSREFPSFVQPAATSQPSYTQTAPSSSSCLPCIVKSTQLLFIYYYTTIQYTAIQGVLYSLNCYQLNFVLLQALTWQGWNLKLKLSFL